VDIIKRKYLTYIKFPLSALAIFFVFKKVDFKGFYDHLQNVNLSLFFIALVSFNVSKVLSAMRLKVFYRNIGLNITSGFNLKLYYIGMFYNLFLPGSIGGDGYKVYLLRRESSCTTKQLISATLMDRISGVAILLSFSFIMFLGVSRKIPVDNYHGLAIMGPFIVLWAYFLFLKIFLPAFVQGFIHTTHLSFWVQVGQVISALMILLSLGVYQYYWDYLLLFMLSSLASVLPITLGGVGLREFVFLLGYRYLTVDKELSIAFTLLFFMVIALSAFIGLFISIIMGTHSLDETHDGRHITVLAEKEADHVFSLSHLKNKKNSIVK
jgi:glycosyltransferase 2 family protein